MTFTTMQQLGILDLRRSPIVIELDDRSRIKPKEVLVDEIVSLYSLEYLMIYLSCNLDPSMKVILWSLGDLVLPLHMLS